MEEKFFKMTLFELLDLYNSKSIHLSQVNYNELIYVICCKIYKPFIDQVSFEDLLVKYGYDKTILFNCNSEKRY